MDPLRISAQFAAYVWYSKRRAAMPQTEATAFAKVNWPTFLPLAHAGLGRLLSRIACGQADKIAKENPDMSKLSTLKTLARALKKQSRR